MDESFFHYELETISETPKNTEAVSTEFIGLDNSSLQFTIEKLNGKNYKEWAKFRKLIINGKGKLGYLTRETKKLKARGSTKMELEELDGDCVACKPHEAYNR